MSDDSSFAHLMETAGAQATGRAVRRLRPGEVVQVTVVQVAEDCIFVDVGTPSDGRIQRAELEDRDGNVRVSVGDTLRATVVDPRPDGPVLAISFGHGGGQIDVASLEMARTSGTPIEGEVARVVKGGLEVTLGAARAFCPASHMELAHVADLNVYVGQRLEFKVLDVRDGGRSIVLSRRALLEDRRRDAAATAKERIIVGSEVEGVVQGLGKHGAVVELDGVEGFIHLSELAPHRVERAEDVLTVGEQVRARVLSVEDSPKGLRVRLSLRAMSTSTSTPRAEAPKAPVDEVLVGTVTRAVQHGVYVQTPRGEGLIPLRELGLPPGGDHRRAYPVGRQLNLVVVNQAGGRLTFSATQVARVEERKNYRDFASTGAAPAPSSLGSLGDLLRQKLGLPSAPAPDAATPVASPSPEPALQPPTPSSAPAPTSRGANAAPAAPAAPARAPVTPDAGASERVAKAFSDGVIRRRR
ncbi:MAG TPA: S1 RNA-binding domain-containing protein [Polyangiaceae bacterium]|nr:S1 RNA-binding domain-containing protein [Polyangiaceae bacterium]